MGRITEAAVSIGNGVLSETAESACALAFSRCDNIVQSGRRVEGCSEGHLGAVR